MSKLFIVFFALMLSLTADATVVRFETDLGDIDIELYEQQAPVTVANFLNYVNRGDYDNTVFHRSVPGFVLQGGGYRYSGNGNFSAVETDSPITLETGVSNVKGTIAMARTSDPNSATNQWFFNVLDNQNLDTVSGGYAAFGRVVRGMDVVNLISSLQIVDFRGSSINFLFEFPTYLFSGETQTFTSVPNMVLNPEEMLVDNVVKIKRAYVLSDTFQINAGLSGAWVNLDTVGQGFYLEVLPALNTLIVAWFTFDSEAPDAAVPSVVADASNRWLTASGEYSENQFTGDVYKTSGGIFDQASEVAFTEVGDISIEFESCSQAVLSYVLNDSGLNHSINIQRVSSANVGMCEEMAAEASQGVSND